jgi:hypothetical protein
MTMVRSANWFNYINLAQADNSGMLRFLTDELQDAEDKGDRGMTLANLPVLFCSITNTAHHDIVSLDHRPRSLRLGWDKWVGGTD